MCGSKARVWETPGQQLFTHPFASFTFAATTLSWSNVKYLDKYPNPDNTSFIISGLNSFSWSVVKPAILHLISVITSSCVRSFTATPFYKMKMKGEECGKSNNNKKTVTVSVDRYDTNMLRVGHEWNASRTRMRHEYLANTNLTRLQQTKLVNISASFHGCYTGFVWVCCFACLFCLNKPSISLIRVWNKIWHWCELTNWNICWQDSMAEARAWANATKS